LRFATHPSVSLDDAGGRFHHLGALHWALGINCKQASVIWAGVAAAAGRGARVLSANALVSMSVPVELSRLSLSPRRRRPVPAPCYTLALGELRQWLTSRLVRSAVM
jgi:hypothetical protein